VYFEVPAISPSSARYQALLVSHQLLIKREIHGARPLLPRRGSLVGGGPSLTQGSAWQLRGRLDRLGFERRRNPVREKLRSGCNAQSPPPPRFVFRFVQSPCEPAYRSTHPHDTQTHHLDHLSEPASCPRGRRVCGPTGSCVALRERAPWVPPPSLPASLPASLPLMQYVRATFSLPRSSRSGARYVRSMYVPGLAGWAHHATGRFM